MNTTDWFASIPTELPDELMETMLTGNSFRLERIVSRGHHSPADFWYDQDEHEWVILLQGEAKLEFESQRETMHLTPGKAVNIPAHCRHRVAWTSPSAETIWLALFYSSQET